MIGFRNGRGGGGRSFDHPTGGYVRDSWEDVFLSYE